MNTAHVSGRPDRSVVEWMPALLEDDSAGVHVAHQELQGTANCRSNLLRQRRFVVSFGRRLV